MLKIINIVRELLLNLKVIFFILGLTEENSDERRVYENQAAKIFTKNPPGPYKNIQTSPCPGKGCSATVDEFEINCKVINYN
jgi:hypothetical protein